jgi:hypothetical protein
VNWALTVHGCRAPANSSKFNGSNSGSSSQLDLKRISKGELEDLFKVGSNTSFGVGGW